MTKDLSPTSEEVQDEIRQLFADAPWLHHLVTDLGHELRTPISGIIGLNELLLLSAIDSEQREYLQATESAARGLLVTLNDVVDVARIDSNKLKLQPSSIPPQGILNECLHAIEKLASPQNIETETEVDPELPDYLTLDANRVRQIINILALNYLRIAEKGRILLTCRKAKSRSKTGVQLGCKVSAVPNFDLADVYRPFQTMDSNLPTKQITTWLRLRLANRLVWLMNGQPVVQPGSNNDWEIGFVVPLPRV